MADPRLLLVTKGLDIGGVERIVTDLAVGLHRRGMPVEVANVNSQRDRLAATIEAAGVTVHHLDGSDTIGPGAARRLAQLVRSSRYDIVHAHGPLVAALVRVAAAGRTPVVTTSHTPWHSLHPLTRAAWRVTAFRDAATLAVSAEVAASLPSREPADVIPHGVDPTLVAAALEAAGSRDTRSTTPLQAITVASHRDAKNYPGLLRAVRAAIDAGARLTLACVGEGPSLPAHRALAAQLGLDDVVSFEPPTEHILHRIAAADVLVVASDYEGQPLVVAEALALGRPVVATAVGRVPEMVTPAVGRVVPPGDPAALGAALAELAADPAVRIALGASAGEHAVGWTLADALDAHQALYRRLSR